MVSDCVVFLAVNGPPDFVIRLLENEKIHTKKKDDCYLNWYVVCLWSVVPVVSQNV